MVTFLLNSVGISFVTNQNDIENWDGLSDIVIVNDFTITFPYTSPTTKSNFTVTGNGNTIYIDYPQTETWNGAFQTMNDTFVSISINVLNINFVNLINLNGLILSNYQPYGTYNITFSRCTSVMSGYFSSYFLT